MKDLFLKRYIELINTEKFAKYEKDFETKIQCALCNAYKQKLIEEDMVLIIESIVNEVNSLLTSNKRFKISTKSIFIHGHNSKVEFKYYGKKKERELGDLIFIISIIYNGRKYFEKFTISQFKKDTKKYTWDLKNKEQLYLLSRFPSFRGKKGSIIPNKEYNLPNYTKCLGSYCLLYNPGDFAFISAYQLENYVENRKSIGVKDLFKLQEFLYCCLNCPTDFNCRIHIWNRTYESIRLGYPKYFPIFFIGVLGISCYARHLQDFIDKYLRGFIGEPTYSEVGIYNSQARIFLNDLLSLVLRKGEKENKREIVDFANEFFHYHYGGNIGSGFQEGIEFYYKGGGIGIIHTIINLGKG